MTYVHVVAFKLHAAAHLNSEQAKSMLDEVRGSVLCFTSALAADLADTQRKVCKYVHTLHVHVC